MTNEDSAPTHCPQCGRAGRSVERITVKALLRPEALTRLSALERRFCATPGCPVASFGRDEAFVRDDLVVTVFRKELEGARTVCFAVTEADIHREIVETGRSSAVERITALVNADRCACEVKNPQGRCCLGNVAEATRRIEAEVQEARSIPTHG